MMITKTINIAIFLIFIINNIFCYELSKEIENKMAVELETEMEKDLELEMEKQLELEMEKEISFEMTKEISMEMDKKRGEFEKYQQPSSSLITRLDIDNNNNNNNGGRKLLGASLGESCSYHTDCNGWGPGTRDVACCQGKCTHKVPDWANVGYCPNECKGCGTCSPGTCPRKELGEHCLVSADCKEGSCCNKECTQLKRDWANVCYCPHQCVGKIFGSPGTCGNRDGCKL